MRLKARYSGFYMGLLSLYIVAMVLGDSNYTQIAFVDSSLTVLKLIVLAGLSLIILINKKWKERKYSLLLLTILAINIIGMFQNGLEINIINLVLLIFASERVKITKIFKTFLMVYTICVLFVVASSLLGIVEDSINIRYSGDIIARLILHSDRYVRHSYGFLFSNQIPFALLTLYLVMIALMGENEKNSWHVVIQLLNVITFILSGARIIFVLIVLSLIFCLIKNKSKHDGFGNTLRAIVKWIYPVLTLFCLSAVYVFYDKIPYWLNAGTNFRFTYAYRTISTYGLHLFGSGFSAGTTNSIVSNYAILDNGYLMLLVQRGILMGIFVIMMWTAISCIAAKKNNTYIIIPLIIIALANLIDYHILSYRFLPFMILVLHRKDASLDYLGRSKKLNNKTIAIGGAGK